MSHNVTPNTSRVELRKTLTLVPVVMMGLAYMQPMTLFDTFGIVSGLTDGHVPTAYAFALIAILFTALSYGKLVRRYPSAGSAYTYAQKFCWRKFILKLWCLPSHRGCLWWRWWPL